MAEAEVNSLGNTKVPEWQSNYAYASSGVKAISSIVMSSLAVQSFKTQVKAQTDAKIANMDGIVDSYEYKAYKVKEAEQALDYAYANKVSESTLDTLKKASYAKVAAAETGTAGGSTAEAIDEHYIDGQFAVAVINAERRLQKTSLLAEAEVSKQNAVNSLKSLASGGVNVKANEMLSALSGFTSTAGDLLVTMPNELRASMFGNIDSGTSGLNIAQATKG